MYHLKNGIYYIYRIKSSDKNKEFVIFSFCAPNCKVIGKFDRKNKKFNFPRNIGNYINFKNKPLRDESYFIFMKQQKMDVMAF